MNFMTHLWEFDMKKFLSCTIIMAILLLNVNAYASTIPPVAGEGAILLDANSGTVLLKKTYIKNSTLQASQRL